MSQVTLKDIAATASSIISFVSPLIKIAAPGTPAAGAIADALDTAGKFLRFADKLTDEHLNELAADLKSIKADVEDMAEHGEHVPQEKWDALGKKMTSAADRIRKAVGK